METLAVALPPEVVEFVAECRRKIYAPDAIPNYYTGRLRERAFRIRREGMFFINVSIEQEGITSGSEYVEADYHNLGGPKLYECHYMYSETPNAKILGGAVAEARRRFIIENPTLVRFGAPEVKLESNHGDYLFRYEEFRYNHGWGFEAQERMSVFNPKLQIVYEGGYIITCFKPNN